MFNKMISSNYLFDCITYDSNQKKKKKKRTKDGFYNMNYYLFDIEL